LNGYSGNFELVDPRVIVIDHRYQRQPKHTLIQHIAQNPSWEAFGVPVCFKRDNGMIYCADGQQRISGILQTEKPPKLIPIVWFPVADLADEAQVFVTINEYRKSLQPIEKHKGKIVAGDEAALAMERAVAKAGFTIDNNVGTGSAAARTIQAVAAIGRVYNRIGEDGVLQTLSCIRDAWPNDLTGTKAAIIRGVADVIEEQGEDYNRSKLVTALKKSQPHLLIRKADELKLDFGGSKHTQMRRAFAVLCGLKMPKDMMPDVTAKPKSATAAKREAAKVA
jgi:hypothetical protein